MKYTDKDLKTILDETGYDCHLCHQPIVFEAYGDNDNLDNWHVDHLRPKSKGGHSGFTNLRATHAFCNQSKGNRSNRSVRTRFGVKGIPASTSTRIWRGVGYAALGVGAIWLLDEIFKPKQNPILKHKVEPLNG